MAGEGFIICVTKPLHGLPSFQFQKLYILDLIEETPVLEPIYLLEEQPENRWLKILSDFPWGSLITCSCNMFILD